jgi:hypothetical protein
MNVRDIVVRRPWQAGLNEPRQSIGCRLIFHTVVVIIYVKRIFIQIASYRDPELVPTIKDCIDKATEPERLVFGICRQFDPGDGFDNLDEYRKDDRFRIIDVPWEEAEGVCWARHRVQQEYAGEEYTLQLDSHHRFVDGWDIILIDMINGLIDKGHSKPLITGYIPSYDPDNDPDGRVKVPWKMDFDRFIPEGAVFFLPSSIDNWKELDAPIPARFYSAHFAFALGKFCTEVPHDPQYYFHGEEISIAVRAFTHGYDLFHPHRLVAWHEYTRKNRAKHWDDHSVQKKTANVKKAWHVRNAESHLRNRKLFEMDGLQKDIDFGIYDFGTVRTLRDYEKYAGLHFKNRAAQEHTIQNKLAPCPECSDEEEWMRGFARKVIVRVDVPLDEVEHGDDVNFWFFGVHDENGKEIYRKDKNRNSINQFIRDRKVHFREQIVTTRVPKSYLIWPCGKDGWKDKVTRPVPGFESF